MVRNTWINKGECSPNSMLKTESSCLSPGSNVWTDTSECSSGNHKTMPECLSSGSCRGSSGIGQGYKYVNKTSCENATDCGFPVSSEQCVWTPNNTWSVNNGCSNDSLETQSACLSIGTCSASSGIGKGESYSNNRSACEAAKDCGAFLSSDPCIWSENPKIFTVRVQEENTKE